MKAISILAVLIAAILSNGCGVSKQLASDCGGDLELGCRQLFGDSEADNEREANQSANIVQLQTDVKSLSNRYNMLIGTVDRLDRAAGTLRSAINVLQSQNANQDAELAQLQDDLLVLNGQVVSTQISIEALQVQVAELETRESIEDYLDCGGNGPGFDEIILRTSSGKLIAYFMEGGNREFLSILTPGNYRTTDQSSCPFTVSNSGQFCDNQGCR